MSENTQDSKSDKDFDFISEIRRAPQKPGVYIFRDRHDNVIYVGKAVNLRNRLRNYFQPSSTGKHSVERSKIMGIQAMARMFEYIVVETELEALVLECNLIKEYMPRYNVRLKDDKSYPYICVTTSEAFPQVHMARKAAKDKNRYYGPFVSTSTVAEVVDLTRSIWPLRRCEKKINVDSPKTRPCLNYHIGKCPAPCGGMINKEGYDKIVADACLFLSGRRGTVTRRLEAEMAAFSENLEFERAAEIRDKLEAVKRLDNKQTVEAVSSGDHDVIAIARGEDEALMQVFFIRDGKMTGRENFIMSGVCEEPDGDVMKAFITQFYSGTAFLPRELDIECEIPEMEIVEEWLKEAAGRKVSLTVPTRGDKLRLIELAKKNAEIQLSQFGDRIKREKERTTGAAAEIAGLLGLSVPLNRIESYDISNVQGYESVASMVVFEDGKPKRNDYRKFKLKTVIGANDYASMEEIIRRRFTRFRKETDEGLNIDEGKFTRLPDALFIDGGKGQVSSAEKAMSAFGLTIPVCGMIKDDRHRTRGLIYKDTEIKPDTHSEGFKLITRIQDETHRFAIEYHRKLREKAMLHSILDDIPGIGKERRKSLLKFFGSIEGIENAEVDSLMKADKMNRRAAEAVYGFFRKPFEDGPERHPEG